MERVYGLQHENPETDDVKLIAAYSSEPRAQAAINRLREQPGFRDFADEFAIDPYEIDADHWTGGFGLEG